MADEEPDVVSGSGSPASSDPWADVRCGSCGSLQRVRVDLPEPRCTSCWRPMHEAHQETPEDERRRNVGCLVAFVCAIVAAVILFLIALALADSLDLESNALQYWEVTRTRLS